MGFHNSMFLSNRFFDSDFLYFLIKMGSDLVATDILYNTPLHFIHLLHRDFFFIEKVLKLQVSVDSVLPNVEENKFLKNAEHMVPPFYGGTRELHTDCCNVFDQTPVSILHKDVPILAGQVLKLQCYAARAVHLTHFMCHHHGSIENGSPNISLEKILIRFPSAIFTYLDVFRKIFVDEATKRQKASLPLTRMQMHIMKYHFGSVQRYDAAHVANVMNRLSARYNLSFEQLQLIEMHGPCKFMHHRL